MYPLKFKPIFKEKMWGGQKIKTELGKDFSPLPNCGETWEISGVEGNISQVAEGSLEGRCLPDLIEEYKEELVGKKVYQTYGNEFPLLVKFLDANLDLSIQVHPDDDLARERHNGKGKTEMWYIFQADPGAKLIAGFNQPLTKEQYLKHLEDQKLDLILNQESVQADESYFIPAGRVHTIGKGLLLAEIQQTSDITYRIYDFDRVDDRGNKRELHTELALDAIDYQHYSEYKTSYDQGINQMVNLASCPYFTTNRLYFDQAVERNYEKLDSFVIYVCVEGKLQLQYDGESMQVTKGDVILLPACIKEVVLVAEPSFKLLESYID
ncbi:MAG: type I phosphomannose isomerase catalytic subunit [Cyclobacteriaceae bacterium]